MVLFMLHEAGIQQMLHSKVNWRQNTMEKIIGYMTIIKCGYKKVGGGVIQEDSATGALGKGFGANENVKGEEPDKRAL